MNEKQQKNRHIKLDEYNHLSLWQMLPCGNGRGLKKLKEIVNSIHNGQALKQSNKPLSLLIVGDTSRLTHAFAFLRALGIEYIQHSPSSMLFNPVDFIEFFYGAVIDYGYIISDINMLPSGNQKKLYQILSKGYYTYMDAGGRKNGAPVVSPIVCTVKKQNLLTDIIINSFEHVIELGEYTPQQKELIALQRLKYSNIEIENDDVLKKLMLLSLSDLSDLIKLLNLSIMVMMSEGRNVLTSRDIQKGKELW
jgi:hypothetical protein